LIVGIRMWDVMNDCMMAMGIMAQCQAHSPRLGGRDHRRADRDNLCIHDSIQWVAVSILLSEMPGLRTRWLRSPIGRRRASLAAAMAGRTQSTVIRRQRFLRTGPVGNAWSGAVRSEASGGRRQRYDNQLAPAEAVGQVQAPLAPPPATIGPEFRACPLALQQPPTVPVP